MEVKLERAVLVEVRMLLRGLKCLYHLFTYYIHYIHKKKKYIYIYIY